MALRVREGKTDQQRVARVARGLGALPRRTSRGGGLLALAAFAMFAVTTAPSGAATASTAKPAATSPSVSSVTVTVPGATPPPAVTAPTVTAPPVTGSPPTVTTPPPAVSPSTGQPAAKPPSASAPPAAPGGQTQSGPAASAQASASGAARRFAATSALRRRNQDASAQQRQLRGTVVRLSQCLSSLSADNQRMLLLRAGIDMAQPDSRGAVAQAFHITVAREASLERGAVLQLQTADRQGTCGSPPVWIHVPAQNRLVPVAAVLISSVQPARGGAALGG